MNSFLNNKDTVKLMPESPTEKISMQIDLNDSIENIANDVYSRFKDSEEISEGNEEYDVFL